jgi:hypothetical protein
VARKAQPWLHAACSLLSDDYDLWGTDDDEPGGKKGGKRGGGGGGEHALGMGARGERGVVRGGLRGLQGRHLAEYSPGPRPAVLHTGGFTAAAAAHARAARAQAGSAAAAAVTAARRGRSKRWRRTRSRRISIRARWTSCGRRRQTRWGALAQWTWSRVHGRCRSPACLRWPSSLPSASLPVSQSFEVLVLIVSTRDSLQLYTGGGAPAGRTASAATGRAPRLT